jgi:hypothetical protein
MPAIFITSTGRTGTWFLTRLINEAVENAWSLHEPKPHFKREGWYLLNHSPGLWHQLYFKTPRRWRQLRNTDEWYVETNYHLFASIPLIRQVWPDAYVVHIVRDGRAVVRSWLNRNRYLANSHVTPAHFPDPSVSAAEWEAFNPLQKNAWYWQAVNAHARQQNPDLILSFEAIFNSEYRDLFALLDLMSSAAYDAAEVRAKLNEKVNKTGNAFFPPFEEWPHFWQEQFWAIARDEMQLLGYA